MDQQQMAATVEARGPLPLNTAIGWFIALVMVLWMMQAPSSRDLGTLAICTAAIAVFCIPGAVLGWAWSAMRRKPYTHSYGLTTASVLLGLIVVSPFAGVGHPILDFSDTVHQPVVAASESAEAASPQDEREWAAAYARFFEDPAKQYLLGPAIKNVFDEKAVSDANAGVPFGRALSNAEAHAIVQLDAVVNPWAYVELKNRPEYSRLKLPGFDRRHKQRVRELLAAGSEPGTALTQAADQVLAEIEQLN